MHLTQHEFWTVIHGLVFGSLYLLAFAGGAEALWSLRPQFFSEEKIKRIKIGVWTMVVASWLTVVSGTYLVYVWYREKIPESPRSKLLADPAKALWHSFGMEWKEHVTWIAPILTTLVAFLVTWYDTELLEREEVRRTIFWLFLMAFVASAIGGLLGAFINKVAPII